MPTKTINDLTNTANILDGDELAFWNLANSRTDKITYAQFKTDLLGLAADTEILFINGTAIDGDSRLTYNPTTNVFSLGGNFNINGNNIINTGTLTLPTATDTLVGRATTDTLTNKSLDANGTGNVITNIGDAEIEAHTSTKITITDKTQLNSAIVYTDQTNTFGDFDQIFPDNRLLIQNPAATFNYTIVGAAIAAARTITLPLLIGGDTFVTEAFTQTLSNKTFSNDVQLKSTTAPAPASPVDSPNFILTSQYDDGVSDKDTDWKHFVEATDDAGASIYTIQTQINGAGYADVFSLNPSFGFAVLSGFSPRYTMVDTTALHGATDYRSEIRYLDSGLNIAGTIGFSTTDKHLVIQNQRTSGEIRLRLNSIPKLNVANALITSVVDLAITPDGTAATPALQIGTETDGFYRSAVNELSISLNNLQEYIFGTTTLDVTGNTILNAVFDSTSNAILSDGTTVLDTTTVNIDVPITGVLQLRSASGAINLNIINPTSGTAAITIGHITSVSLAFDEATGSGFVIDGRGAGSKVGLQYAADYSADAGQTDLSIIHRGFLLNSNHTITGDWTFNGATNLIFSDGDTTLSSNLNINRAGTGTHDARLEFQAGNYIRMIFIDDLAVDTTSTISVSSVIDIQIFDGTFINQIRVADGDAGILLAGTSANFQGAIYNADYSADFVARSLVDMAFTDATYLPLGGGTLTGDLTISAQNIITDATTGTKIGTASTQKLGFWGATPLIRQGTASQTPATFVANSSGIVDDTGAWNGYTIGDIVAILQAIGLIA